MIDARLYRTAELLHYTTEASFCAASRDFTGVVDVSRTYGKKSLASTVLR